MMKLRLVLTAVVSMTLGIFIGGAATERAAGQTPGAATQAAGAGPQTGAPRPAYLIASSRPIAPDKMGPYRQAAGPLARQAGMEILAQGDPTLHLLEGKWPHAGGLTVERYRSMQDLLAFWNSPGYQQAKKLREGFSEVNFIVAIEGR